jgi:hypothetical protein
VTTIVILAGHGRGLVGPAYPKFPVPQNTFVHFLWKFMCTYNDPVDVLPPIIADAIKGECRTDSVKTSDDYEAIHGAGDFVHEHLLFPTPQSERQGLWDPAEVAKKFGLRTETHIEMNAWHVKVAFYHASANGNTYVVVSPFPEKHMPLKLSELVDYAHKSYTDTGVVHIYWWACRSPAYDHGNYLSALYYGKWKRHGNTYAPRDREVLKNIKNE